MDPPPHRSFYASGIPKLSRLPVPLATVKVPPLPEPSKRAFTGRGFPESSHQIGTNPANLEEIESGTNRLIQQAATNKSQTLETLVAGNIDSMQPEHAVKSHIVSRRPRPSLSDRTIETLSQIPPSPSPRRRRSSFFPPESPPASSSRPTSSLSRSRPSTSHGQRPPLPSGVPTPRPSSPPKHPISHSTPNRRAVSSHISRPMTHPKGTQDNTVELTPSKSKPPLPGAGALARHDNENGTNVPKMRLGRAAQTLAARPSKQRPSVQGAFVKPFPEMTDKSGSKSAGMTRKLAPTISAGSTDTGSTLSKSSKTSHQKSSEPAKPASTLSKPPTSSTALRDTIAKAKAARRKVGQSQGLSAQETDDFPEIEIGGNNKILLRKRVASARLDGRLNIAAMGLKDIPSEVLTMYNADSFDAGDGAWYESVDLKRLVAADNEFEHLGDDVFPDVIAEAESALDDDFQGILFAGLDTLDMHGNHLQTVPLGLRRLEHLTTLNLSKNRLGNQSLNVMTQIGSLRELRLAENILDGMLCPQLLTLRKLEILDVSNNAITTLPPNSDKVSKLRVLNVAGNKLSSLPFELLAAFPLIEIYASGNRLGGALFPSYVSELRMLKILDVASNALTSVVESGTVDLPLLQSFDVAENRLVRLPQMQGWTELLTLSTAGNRLASLPESIFSLKKLKSADFSRNDIKKLDDRLGLMENLATLRIAHNPLRERKFLTMDTDTLKHELRMRLLPAESSEKTGDEIMDCQGLGPAADSETAAPKSWHIRPGGVVDRSSANLETIEALDFDFLVQGNDVQTLNLHHNLITQVPQAIELIGSSLKILDLSRNKFAGSNDYILTNISLPNLRSLNLSNNAITSMTPLLDLLSAPQLSEINFCRNHITSLPVLRESFPALVTVYASQNSLSELLVESVRGLQVLDVSGNAIVRLDPKLGLLGAEGLRSLVIGANRFRVPRREVVDKGTEAVLAWLKGRIPEGEFQDLG